MSFLGKVFGASGKGVAEPIEAVGNVLDNLFTSKEEKLNAEQAKLRLLQIPGLVNQEINKIEAQHRSIFVAGWRPFIGWVCGSALLYAYILRDLISWAMEIYTPGTQPPPMISMEFMNTILLGMLGLGAARTVEKINKVSK